MKCTWFRFLFVHSSFFDVQKFAFVFVSFDKHFKWKIFVIASPHRLTLGGKKRSIDSFEKEKKWIYCRQFAISNVFKKKLLPLCASILVCNCWDACISFANVQLYSLMICAYQLFFFFIHVLKHANLHLFGRIFDECVYAVLFFVRYSSKSHGITTTGKKIAIRGRAVPIVDFYFVCFSVCICMYV